MPVTINRTLRATACTLNGVAIGGVTTITPSFGFREVIVAPMDGAGGPTLIHRSRQQLTAAVTFQDAADFINALTGAAGDLVFYSKLSGDSKYLRHTMGNNADVAGKGTIRSASISFRRGQLAVVNADMEFTVLENTYGIKLAWKVEDNATAGWTLVGGAPGAGQFNHIAATRYDQLRSVTTAGAINPRYLESLTVNVRGSVESASHDADIGTSVIDVPDYDITGSIEFQDAGIQKEVAGTPAGSPDREYLDLVSLPLQASGNIVLTARKHDDTGNITLTIKNAKFLDGRATYNASAGYDTFTSSFQCEWTPSVPDTLSTMLVIA